MCHVFIINIVIVGSFSLWCGGMAWKLCSLQGKIRITSNKEIIVIILVWFGKFLRYQLCQLWSLWPLHFYCSHMSIFQTSKNCKLNLHNFCSLIFCRGQRLQISLSFHLAGQCQRILSDHLTITETVCQSSWVWYSVNMRLRRRDSVQAEQHCTLWWHPMVLMPSVSRTGLTWTWDQWRWLRVPRPSCSRPVCSWQWPSGGRRHVTSWTRSITNAGNS